MAAAGVEGEGQFLKLAGKGQWIASVTSPLSSGLLLQPGSVWCTESGPGDDAALGVVPLVGFMV